ETDTGKLQPLPEVPGKGKEKVGEEQAAQWLEVGLKTKASGKLAEGQAGPNPDDVAESLPLPTPSVLAGPNPDDVAEYSVWTTTDTQIKPSIIQIPDDLYMDDETTANEQAISSDDEVGRDHVPTVNLSHSRTCLDYSLI
ncbi:hypothetical protein Tco_1039317, partial [Tanacetum coccineum]